MFAGTGVCGTNKRVRWGWCIGRRFGVLIGAGVRVGENGTARAVVRGAVGVLAYNMAACSLAEAYLSPSAMVDLPPTYQRLPAILPCPLESSFLLTGGVLCLSAPCTRGGRHGARRHFGCSGRQQAGDASRVASITIFVG